MKAITLSMLLALVSAVPSFPGALINDPRVYPVLIAGNRSGSGCYLRLSNSIYLVTAKHVLFADPEGTNTPELASPNVTLISYSAVGTSNISKRVYKANLEQLYRAGEIRCSQTRDVALVRVEELASSNSMLVSCLPGFTAVSGETGLTTGNAEGTCRIDEVDVGCEVFMFGYPTSLTASVRDLFDPTEPLLRGGVVAGVNRGNRTVIIDCPSYFGNSGGPVVQVERFTQGTYGEISTVRFRIIGVVSSFVPFQEEWENKTMRYSHVIKSNSGYTVIEPMDTVLDMVWE